MAYDANYPADNITLAQGPAAIRNKGADLKTLIDGLGDTKLNKANQTSTYGYHYRDVAGYSTQNAGANTTGTLKITLPVSWTNTLLNITIKGYEHRAGSNWFVEVSGFNTPPVWSQPSVTLSPNCPFTSVRFAHDGAKCCILLGTTSTVWQYPQIVVSDVYASYIGGNLFGTGWGMAFITSETGITVSGSTSIKTLVDDTRTDVFAPAGYGVGGTAKGLPGMDLNTITDCGFYNYYSSTPNKPTGGSGFVSVLYAAGYSVQIATDLIGAVTYTRSLQAGTWSAWQRLAVTDDITASGTNFSFRTDNAYSFGTSAKRASQLYAATATINTSDRNAKKDIMETQLGLDFINKLKPVEYKYKVRQNVVEQIQDGTQTIEIAPAEINEKGEVIKKAEVQEIPTYKEVVKSLPGIRTHLGLIAQEVEECLGGRDIAIVTKDGNGYGLRYEELIAPLIKAVQELSAEVAELRNNTGK